MRGRWILLALYLLLIFAWYFVTLSVLDPLGFRFDLDSKLLDFGASTLVLFGLQFLLLLGAPQVHWPRSRRRRSIFVSLAAGSVIAMLLSIGAVLALVSLNKVVNHSEAFQDNFTVVAIGPTTAPAPPPPKINWRTDVPWGWIGVVLTGWAFWFVVFAFVGRGQWVRGFSRMYRVLVAGTVLELLITIPIDVQIRRRTNCYCGEGTFFSLAIGLTAVLWAFGPGVAILFLIRQRQRLLEAGRCLQCGYSLQGLESDRCPECGTRFNVVAQPV